MIIDSRSCLVTRLSIEHFPYESQDIFRITLISVKEFHKPQYDGLTSLSPHWKEEWSYLHTLQYHQDDSAVAGEVSVSLKACYYESRNVLTLLQEDGFVLSRHHCRLVTLVFRVLELADISANEDE